MAEIAKSSSKSIYKVDSIKDVSKRPNGMGYYNCLCKVGNTNVEVLGSVLAIVLLCKSKDILVSLEKGDLIRWSNEGEYAYLEQVNGMSIVTYATCLRDETYRKISGKEEVLQQQQEMVSLIPSNEDKEALDIPLSMLKAMYDAYVDKHDLKSLSLVLFRLRGDLDKDKISELECIDKMQEVVNQYKVMTQLKNLFVG